VLRAAGLAAAAPLFTACGAVDNLFSLDTIRVAVTWSDSELAAFRSVVDDFLRLYPRYQVDVIPLGDDIASALSSGANGRPDVVMMPRPGLVQEHVDQLAPLDDLWNPNFYAPGWPGLVDAGSPPRSYGVPFKLANESALWYRKDLFDAHNIRAPRTWSEWLGVNDRLIGLGITPLALGAGDGWPLSGFFDNVLESCFRDYYDSLAVPNPRVELWRAREFTTALRLFGTMLSVPGVLSGGVDRTLVQQFPDAVVEVFGYHRAAMVVSADFAEPIIREFLQPPATYDVVRFPLVDGIPVAHQRSDNTDLVAGPRRASGRPPLVIGADIAVLPTPVTGAARDFVSWLAGSEAPLPWITGHGGFIGPNRNTDTRHYTPAVCKLLPTQAELNDPGLVFDLSDELGSLGGSGAYWQVLEDFLRTVGDGHPELVDSAAETAAARMYDIGVSHGR
jgi:alpha-glucoside transport system substrate-binding protein